jgi:hypothetical protein
MVLQEGKQAQAAAWFQHSCHMIAEAAVTPLPVLASLKTFHERALVP